MMISSSFEKGLIRKMKTLHELKSMSGVGQAETKLHEVGDSSFLAVVSAIAGKGKDTVKLRYLIIFNDEDEVEIEEAREITRKMFNACH